VHVHDGAAAEPCPRHDERRVVGTAGHPRRTSRHGRRPTGQRSWSVGRISTSLIATCGGWLTR
jgi:hypothetical protein